MSDRIKLNRQQANTSLISNPLLAASPQVTSADSSFTHSASTRHDLSRIAPFYQAKLSVSQPGDAYEREADKVAQQVMEMGDSSLQQEKTSSAEQNLQRQLVAASITPLLQRAESLDEFIQRECPLCGEEPEELHRSPLPEHHRQDVQVETTAELVLQRLGEPLKDKPKIKPASGTTKDGEQRQYSVEQYIEMWEAEQGRKLTDDEKLTLARGCIGITALDISGDGNPPLDECYATFDQAKAKVDKRNNDLAYQRDFFANYPDLIDPNAYAILKKQRAILFAKLFWSNQDPDEKKRKKPNKKAFKPDKKTGQVDMSGYNYLDRPGFVNFDYGFWDEASQSFWHANHRQPGMKVYQSTKEKFAKGYIDFDRIVYCVAIATNYDPAKAAKSP